MYKDYIKFILAYDYGKVFERMELACDEAFDLADEIAGRFLLWKEENDDMNYSDYELLQQYCNHISFYEVWQEMWRNSNGYHKDSLRKVSS